MYKNKKDSITFTKEEADFIKSLAEMALDMIGVAVMGEYLPQELESEKAQAQNILNKIKGFHGKA